MDKKLNIFPIDINGYHFVNCTDAAKQLGINRITIMQRIKLGWTLEEVFGFKEHKSKRKYNLFPIDINGYHFNSYSDAAKQLGINSNTIMQRIKSGWVLEEVFGFKEHKRKYNLFPIDINGYHFISYVDASNQLGISVASIYKRIKLGWTLEEVFGFKEHNTNTISDLFPIDINGYYFESCKDAERQLGIRSDTIRSRINLGWTLEEAFGFKEHIHKGTNKSIFPIDINGYHFISYVDVSNQLGISVASIYKRIKNGWPLEEVFGFKEHINLNNSSRKFQHFKYGLNPKEKLSDDLYLCYNPSTNTKELYSYEDLIKLKED